MRDKLIRDIVDRTGDWVNDGDRLMSGNMTSELYPYKKLFEPIQINKLKIKNRIVMGPMGNISMADEMGKPNQKLIKYFIERAKGGVGLITSGMVPVSYDLDPSFGDLDATGIFPRIDKHRTVYSGWRDIVEGCHAYGARFFIQLAPGSGRVGNPECLTKKMKLPVSSSWNPNWYIPQIPCRPLTDRACKKIIKATGQAAIDAKELGIDGVYLHGHSGYLIEQMTDPAFNKRKLGRYKDWQRFGIDMVREIRNRCGDYYPIHYRIDLSLAMKETYGDRMNNTGLKRFSNGRNSQMTIEYMKNLVKAGVDIFDIDLGGYENWWMPHPPNGMPPGVYLDIAEHVKSEFESSNVKSNIGIPVPIIAVGKLGFPDLAESALREDKCDMVMLSRPLLADPQWPNKVYAGRVKEITPCIGDHEGCLGQLAIGGHPHCAVNPRTAFEDIYMDDIRKADIPKRIAVVGAGPAGTMTALAAARRGHDVTIYDSNHKAGGVLLYGSVPKIKYELVNYIDYLNNEIIRVSKEYKLRAIFNTEVSKDTLDGDYDAIITCTGGTAAIPPVEGVDKSHVITAIDILKHPRIVEEYKDILVVGGSDVGCEVAFMLGYEMNKKPVIIEMEPYFMKRTCTSNRNYMIHHLERIGVKLMNCTTLNKIKDNTVEVTKNTSKGVPDPYNTWTPILPDNIDNPFKKKIEKEYKPMILKADLVIMCTGTRPNDTLYEELKRNNIAPEIYNIGDSFSGGRVLEAVKAGYALGNSI